MKDEQNTVSPFFRTDLLPRRVNEETRADRYPFRFFAASLSACSAISAVRPNSSSLGIPSRRPLE
jgi:hypothetical protein